MELSDDTLTLRGHIFDKVRGIFHLEVIIAIISTQLEVIIAIISAQLEVIIAIISAQLEIIIAIISAQMEVIIAIISVCIVFFQFNVIIAKN